MYATSRREVLRTLAAGSGAFMLSPQSFFSSSRQNKDRLGVALVGLGYYSTDLLAPALQLTKQCYLAGAVSGTPSKLTSWQERHRLPDANLYSYENFDTIANNPDIDV